FVSQFWQSLQEAFGTQLDMSTAYHPEAFRMLVAGSRLNSGNLFKKLLELNEYNFFERP
ncbi:hypothetical protein Tco_0457268, partial [Tanacetum coccineum]